MKHHLTATTMSPSTASTKSICLTLALAALITSSSVASGDEAHLASLGPATVINRVPIRLPSLTPAIGYEEIDRDTRAQRNASAHPPEEEGEEFGLPAELAAMIANATMSRQEPVPAAALTSEAAPRYYYPTYDTEGGVCSSKPAAEFESWDESYASLAECCDVAFSWDYEACAGL